MRQSSSRSVKWCVLLARECFYPVTESVIQVSSRIREDLLQRAGEFNIVLEDVSITHLTFGKVCLSPTALILSLPSRHVQEFTQVRT